MQYTLEDMKTFETADLRGLLNSVGELRGLIVSAKRMGNRDTSAIVDSYIDMIAKEETAQGYPLDREKYKNELLTIYSNEYGSCP